MASGSFDPPIGIAMIDPQTGALAEVWRVYFRQIGATLGLLAPIDATYWVSSAAAALTAERNLGALTSGYLKVAVAIGIATPSTVAKVPTADLSGTLLAAQFPALTGDVTTAAGALATTLAASGVTAAVYGDATHVPQVTIDAKGRVTLAAPVLVAGVAPGGAAGGDLSSTYPNPTVAKINGVALGSTLATSGNLLVADGANWVSKALSGDATVVASGALTLAATAVAAGAYGSSTAIPTFTVDAKGRLIAASTAAVVAPAGTLTGGALAAGVTASSLTSVGTLVGGATGAGFTVALTTSTITGTLADARLSANVPLLNAANAFTANQTFSGGTPITLNGTAAYSLAFQNNGTLKALHSQAFANDDAIGGSVAGDHCIRTQGGNLLLSTNSGVSAQLIITSAQIVRLPGYTAASWVAGDKYVVIDANGNLHRSAVGPAS